MVGVLAEASRLTHHTGWGERQRFSSWRSVNFLTVPEQRDPLSDTSNLKTWLCRITAL